MVQGLPVPVQSRYWVTIC